MDQKICHADGNTWISTQMEYSKVLKGASDVCAMSPYSYFPKHSTAGTVLGYS